MAGIADALEEVEGAASDPTLDIAMGSDDSVLVQSGSGEVKRASRSDKDPRKEDDEDEESEDETEEGDDEDEDDEQRASKEDDEDEDGKAAKGTRNGKGKARGEDDDEERMIKTTFGEFDGKKLTRAERRAIRRTDRTIQNLGSKYDTLHKEYVALERRLAREGERGKAMGEVAKCEDAEAKTLRALERARKDGEADEIKDLETRHREAIRATEKARIKAESDAEPVTLEEDAKRARRDDLRSERPRSYAFDDLADDAEEYLEDFGAIDRVDPDKFTGLVVDLMNYIPQHERQTGERFEGGDPERQKQAIMREALKTLIKNSRDAKRGRERGKRASNDDVSRRSGKESSRLPMSRRRFVPSGRRRGSEGGDSERSKSRRQQPESQRSLSDVMHGIK